MATDQRLLKFADDAEDVASGLHAFRDGLPRSATRITATIAVLFAISTSLRAIGDLGRLAPRVQDDLALVCPTLRSTLDVAFDMFAMAPNKPLERAWQDLCDRMERVEGIGLLERLKWYNDFLSAQEDVISGYRTRDLEPMRQQLASLLDAQELLDHRARRQTIDISAASTPRPRYVRRETAPAPRPREDWEAHYRRSSMPPPVVPQPPTSPTFTSSSSQTLNSSQTSYSSDTAFVPAPPPPYHWSQDVFDGQNPGSQFDPDYQLNQRSRCVGTVENTSLLSLVRDGFVRAFETEFDSKSLWVRMYFRPPDRRACILIMTIDSSGQEVQFSQRLTNLKVLRDNSSLQLCRMRRPGHYVLWARLNFVLYERMVLFYCTFVAMKRQDQRQVEHEDMLENCQLFGHPDNPQEELLFSSKVRFSRMLHVLRLYRDRGSNVVRLEASAHRGPMENVPIWTAFVTRYVNNGDQDWAAYEGDNMVSLAALRPPPYTFVDNFVLPRNREGHYMLQFNTDNDARFFVEQWTALCR